MSIGIDKEFFMSKFKITPKGFVAAAVMAGALSGGASAFAATVGAGSPIGVGSDQGGDACTINSVGSTQNGKAALTAGHCGNPGDKVYLTTPEGDVEIGTIVWSSGNPQNNGTGDDVALIQLNADVTTTNQASTTNALSTLFPVGQYPGRTVTGPSDTVAPGTIVYKDGATLGRVPGMVISSDPNGDHDVLTVSLPGDSGGAVYDAQTGQMVGITSRGALFYPVTTVQGNREADQIVASHGHQYTYESRDNGPQTQGSWPGMRVVKDAPTTIDNGVQPLTMTPEQARGAAHEGINQASDRAHGRVDGVSQQAHVGVDNAYRAYGDASQSARDFQGEAQGAIDSAASQVNSDANARVEEVYQGMEDVSNRYRESSPAVAQAYDQAVSQVNRVSDEANKVIDQANGVIGDTQGRIPSLMGN